MPPLLRSHPRLQSVRISAQRRGDAVTVRPPKRCGLPSGEDPREPPAPQLGCGNGTSALPTYGQSYSTSPAGSTPSPPRRWRRPSARRDRLLRPRCGIGSCPSAAHWRAHNPADRGASKCQVRPPIQPPAQSRMTRGCGGCARIRVVHTQAGARCEGALERGAAPPCGYPVLEHGPKGEQQRRKPRRRRGCPLYRDWFKGVYQIKILLGDLTWFVGVADVTAADAPPAPRSSDPSSGSSSATNRRHAAGPAPASSRRTVAGWSGRHDVCERREWREVVPCGRCARSFGSRGSWRW
jgi:hypothetical protein